MNKKVVNIDDYRVLPIKNTNIEILSNYYKIKNLKTK